MNILHICSDYFGSLVFSQLFKAIASLHTLSQTIYVPFYTKKPAGRHRNDKLGNSPFKVIYSQDFKKHDRFLYNRKIQKITNSITNQLPMNEISLIHSHSLFSMGGIARSLKTEFGVKYILAVRNTDVNYFFKYAIHLRSVGLDIMKDSEKIIFLSPSHRKRVLDLFVPIAFREFIKSKSVVIPNGIDDFWLTSPPLHRKVSLKRNIHLIFVGELTRNKNIETCIQVAKALKSIDLDVKLSVVGDGPKSGSLHRFASRALVDVEFLGWVKSKNDLMAIYRKADIFIMPSFNETFGLAYIEAMSQGLPIIYTKNQGIDRYFDNGSVGFACNPTNVGEIVNKISQIMTGYQSFSQNAVAASKHFSWAAIGDEYNKIYFSIINQEKYFK